MSAYRSLGRRVRQLCGLCGSGRTTTSRPTPLVSQPALTGTWAYLFGKPRVFVL